MTEFELHYLISECIGHLTLTYQSWFGASSAILLVSHYIGGKIDKTLGNVITVAYVVYSLVCFLGLIKFYYAIQQYMQVLEKDGALQFPKIPFLDIFNGYLLFYLYIGGTIFIAVYFIKKCGDRIEETSN